ncbi:Uncharacterized protein dnm_005290 [Desulfonema magnum]|uniref:Uncharacterized protein n=1 Tax=Desulfonema magnum TaxID=45655 RepID=A0A975BFH6_9BACT|nr:Uncharacterized protein dnm_005290 [Desulfonema magnum]
MQASVSEYKHLYLRLFWHDFCEGDSVGKKAVFKAEGRPDIPISSRAKPESDDYGMKTFAGSEFRVNI